jgi:hypothetical protein
MVKVRDQVADQHQHVRFGSLADVEARERDVRFTPESGHSRVSIECLLSANSGHRGATWPRRTKKEPRGPPSLCDEFMFSSVSKPTSIGTRCNDGTRALPRSAGRLALPQRRRSTRRRSNHCDGSGHKAQDESQARIRQRLE